MATVLWCYLRTTAFKRTRTGTSPPPHRPGHHLGVTIEADIIKQKLPKIRGYQASYGRFQHANLISAIYTISPAITPID